MLISMMLFFVVGTSKTPKGSQNPEIPNNPQAALFQLLGGFGKNLKYHGRFCLVLRFVSPWLNGYTAGSWPRVTTLRPR